MTIRKAWSALPPSERRRRAIEAGLLREGDALPTWYGDLDLQRMIPEYPNERDLREAIGSGLVLK